MSLFFKLSEIFVKKINNDSDIELNTLELNEIIEQRYEALKKSNLSDSERIEQMLEDNEHCILEAEKKIKNIVFSMQTIQAEKKIISAYYWRQ